MAWLSLGLATERVDGDTKLVKEKKTADHQRQLRELIPIWEAENRAASEHQ
jgi:hypothetical protein